MLFAAHVIILGMVSLVIFSDLDGTLLDHDTYTWKPALTALASLAKIGAPVVLATSKTAAEVVSIQAQMGLDAYPAIVENGAGIIGLGSDDSQEEYSQLRTVLDDLPADIRTYFYGFGDMTVADVTNVTGLSSHDANLAKTRAFSEPGIWSGSDVLRDEFIACLAERGVHARSGGRFLTLSFGKTKRDGMTDVIAHYDPRLTVALGDAPNDVEMLEYADFGFIISNPHHTPLPVLAGESAGRITRTERAGPTGWADAMMGFLDQHDLPKEGPNIG